MDRRTFLAALLAPLAIKQLPKPESIYDYDAIEAPIPMRIMHEYYFVVGEAGEILISRIYCADSWSEVKYSDLKRRRRRDFVP